VDLLLCLLVRIDERFRVDLTEVFLVLSYF